MGHDKYESVVNGVTTSTRYRSDWSGEIYCDESALNKPLRWRKPRRVFVCSMSDLFHPKVPFEFIHKIWDVMKACPQHVFIVLTKQPGKMAEDVGRIYELERLGWAKGFWEHLWLGVSVCVPEEKSKIDTLRNIPAAVKFVSFEPLLRDMGELDLTGIQWVIVGGESGPGARPMHPDWARSIRDQRAAAGVPFFFKQWGAYAPTENVPLKRRRAFEKRFFYGYRPIESIIGYKADGTFEEVGQMGSKPNSAFCDANLYRVGKKAAGRLLDGKKHEEYPK
jgi:protein gp37